MEAVKDYRSKMLENPVYALEAAKSDFIMDVTESICEILEEKKIERKQLAEKMNRTKGYISQLLNGHRNMTLNSLAEIAYVLGYTPKIVFEKKDDDKINIEIEPTEIDYTEDTEYLINNIETKAQKAA